MRFSFKVAAATVVVAGAVAGVGQAAISNNGVVTMCVSNTTGAVRAVDPSGVARPCANTETVLPMNQQGPAGAQGPAGPQGAPGPVSLPSVSAKWRKGSVAFGSSYGTVVDLPLFKGAYHVTAKGTAYMQEVLGHDYWSAVTCQLRVTHADGKLEIMDAGVVEVSDGGPEYASFALQGVMRVGTAVPETAQLACKDDGGYGYGDDAVTLQNLNLHAVPVSGYVQTQM
ncbi:hypothetical protein OJ997_12265 [Solirubrobacter phytolaccae]|uniref:Secreted protein n=1 Tax=Solirubrobacter phytolaccae TaxID=1404360 RepID=A0A9X3N7C4_9ACTN|nr:hypothetical protein [Solirubrobacter phytolaccae]MDA0181073.1 hypothetical protein [Solirubrobacter phytolaccae]